MYFELRCGEKFAYELRCEDSKNAKKTPFIISNHAGRYLSDENVGVLDSILINLQTPI